MNARLERAERARPKLVLLVRLLAALDEGAYDFAALKEYLDPERPPSTRSLRRYLATLAEAGFPWYYDRATATYRFEDGYRLRPLELSGADVLGLHTLHGVADSLGTHFGGRIGRVAETLERAAGTKARAGSIRVQSAGVELDARGAAAYDALERAQASGQSVRFSYSDKRGARTLRHVDPYGFVVSGGRVYLVAFDRTRGANRTFALDALEDPRIDPSRAAARPEGDLRAFAADSVSGTIDAAATTRVRVRFAASVARAARADRIVRERTVTERSDGGIEIDYAVADARELVRWTLGWGAEAEVVAPPDARAYAAEIVATLAERYAAPVSAG